MNSNGGCRFLSDLDELNFVGHQNRVQRVLLHENGGRFALGRIDDVLVIKLVHATLVRVPVGQFVEVRVTAFQATLEGPTPDVDIHLVALELGLSRVALSTDTAHVGLLVVLHVLVNLVDPEFFSSLEGLVAHVALHLLVMDLGVVIVEQVGAGKVQVTPYARLGRVVVVYVLTHFLGCPQCLVAVPARLFAATLSLHLFRPFEFGFPTVDAGNVARHLCDLVKAPRTIGKLTLIDFRFVSRIALR